ncbi:ATP-binding cassette domain-containing protein [Demequina sp. TTPB684]|uniref:ABC transporter ATP-binding protein n=1 Tax=unclassified Demequina TaxID=2620311 RepID=UPI001CF2B8DC|nr:MULTISPECIES: ATP-binding cassette domain-containing protein [unclassified Demequina]MCB2411908.1 ATP-binding cassette domain-containing protein [Demequina sp. TTPB684]UPU89368.1 ATP-binding cassette domain-containing protein [Demequina sp. TMPB413]
MIEAQGLTKRYGPTTAVDHMSFTVEPGRVTGFLGPNGAGKSTTMRMIVGLDRPTDGSVTVNGSRYAQHRAPLQEVGVLLDAKAIHTGRTARNHLRAMAATHGISIKRVDEVIDMTGLGTVANKRVGGFSLGMGQRLGIASALLGDPQTLILDEPVNGLDPEGVLWVRNLTKYLASQGRTVFLSSHLMSEMALTADHLIVVGRGHVLADAPVADVVASASGAKVRVRSPRANELEELLRRTGAGVTVSEPGLLDITGATAIEVGDAAAAAGLPLHELTPVSSSLEDAYLQLTADEVEYHSTPVGTSTDSGAAPQKQGASR